MPGDPRDTIPNGWTYSDIYGWRPKPIEPVALPTSDLPSLSLYDFFRIVQDLSEERRAKEDYHAVLLLEDLKMRALARLGLIPDIK